MPITSTTPTQRRQRAARSERPLRPSGAEPARTQQLRAGAGEQRENSVASVKIRPGTRTPFQPGA